ncbi:MAG: AraC family transcriptional regulator [Verrucomicrobiaceae bacterium]|nr:MAG: AraC family transcriptional regulator [Verrucomicrobiaceae bacterium]
MRIVRTEIGWKVLAPRWPKGLCLRSLATRSGYRVGEICDRLGCSESYFRRVFLRDVGVGPKQWLRDQRMLAAKQRLQSGIDSWQLAVELGFASQANFLREFRVIFGMVPDRWRKLVSGAGSRGDGAYM